MILSSDKSTATKVFLANILHGALQIKIAQKPQTNMRQRLLPPPMTGPWLYHLQRWNEVGKKPLAQATFNTKRLNSPSNQQQTKDIFTLSASFLPIYAARAVPTWAVGKFSGILETSKTTPKNYEMLAKNCFQIKRSVRRENIIIASLLLLFSVKMIMCRGVPELHLQRVLDRMMQMELFAD